MAATARVPRPSGLAGLITQPHQCAEEAEIGWPIRKVALAAQAQRLIDRLLEANVGLFDIAILVGFARLVGGGLDCVVQHERLIAFGIVPFTARFQRDHRRAEIVGAMLAWHAAQLPHAGLHAFG